MSKSKSIFIVTSKGICVKVYLDLNNNYVRGMQKGAIPFLRKIGWDIEKLDKRNRKNWKDLKRKRIFRNG